MDGDGGLAFGIGVILGGLLWLVVFNSTDCAVAQRGGDGMRCYPNRTCDEKLTCYELSEDEFECREKVEPAVVK